jgi:hypothetical protein
MNRFSVVYEIVCGNVTSMCTNFTYNGFYMLKIINMAKMRNFQVMSGKFNVVGLSAK